MTDSAVYTIINGEKIRTDGSAAWGNVYEINATFCTSDYDEYLMMKNSLTSTRHKNTWALAKTIEGMHDVMDDDTSRPAFIEGKPALITSKGVIPLDNHLEYKEPPPTPPIIKNRTNYEKAYWDFVDARTQDVADEAFDKLVDQVTMELEPAGDGSSWSLDRPGRPAVFKHDCPKRRALIPNFTIMILFWCLCFLILHLVGVLP